MSLEDCMNAISADPLNQSLATPLFFRESTAPPLLRNTIYRLTGHTSFFKYMKSIHPSVSYYGIHLRTTGEIVQGSYWAELMGDEEEVYCLV